MQIVMRYLDHDPIGQQQRIQAALQEAREIDMSIKTLIRQEEAVST